jgi:hypothetical protein
MSAAVLKGFLALLAACVFLAVAAARFVTRRGLPSALQALGIGCFGVMALTHVFEEFAVFPTFGWGQPHTVGHLIDLVAALLGILFVTIGFFLWRRDHRRSELDAHRTVAPSNNRVWTPPSSPDR